MITNLDPKKGLEKTWRWIIPAIMVVVVLATLLLRRNEKQGTAATFAVRRGPLSITVIEGGNARAVESQDIKCEVRVGYQGVKILKMVEEGYEVTPEDIRTNKVLVELDSSELQKQITEKEIGYESAAASLTDAQQNYEIQVNQNLSDIKAAEQKVRFARMDFDKYLGDKVTDVIVAKLGIEEDLANDLTNALAEAQNALKAPTNAAPEPTRSKPANKPPAQIPPVIEGGITAVPTPAPEGGVKVSQTALVLPADAELPRKSENQKPKPVNNPGDAKTSEATIPDRPVVVIDFSEYGSIDALGDGEAKQKLRKFEDDLQVAKKEEGQAKNNLGGTKRLFDKGFVTRVELEKDEIAAENNRLKVQTAQTAQELFLKYEFPKTAEEGLSKYAETARELNRARKAAISKLAQAKAKLKSAQGQFNIQSRQRKELYDQQGKCMITATKPGLVVYGRGGDEGFFGGEERIREGASVREQQPIITIPNMTKMSVRVKVHESYIRKVKKGQKAQVTVDAFSDKVLQGEVTTVGVIPASQDMWLNPDMKVYLTTITIAGTNDWLKPGMNAKVEILVNRLENVVYVPMQAVSPFEGKQVCFVAGRGKPERRIVQTGEFNDEFIEIKSGLKEGEVVLLRAAETPADAGGEKEKEKEAPDKKKDAAPMPASMPRKA